MTESDRPEQSAGGQGRTYDASRIQVLEGLDAVRKRPGMYIGSTSERGLHEMVYELVRRSVEEAAAGYADTVDVTVTADGAVRVTDNGRGLPVAAEGPDGRPAVEVALTELWAGRESKGLSAVDGPLGSIGLCVVNALSGRLVVEVHRDGFRWTQEHRRGVPLSPLARHEETARQGTAITFWADPEVFGAARYSFPTLARRFEEWAFLHAGLTVSLTGERPSAAVRYRYGCGVRDLVPRLGSSRGAAVHPTVIHCAAQAADGSCSVDVAMQWRTASGSRVESFANATRTVGGGSHETGLRAGLVAAVNAWARQGRPPAAGADAAGELTVEEVMQGLTAVVSVRLVAPSYAGAMRAQLDSPEAGAYVQDTVRAQLTDWLNHHPAEAEDIVRRIGGKAARV
ncbi:ATP-binding protein [Streptomyces xanthophaeus]|uniref:ATP-binding protein n=1 Tax=Streptomyces xanthophaeus TaxID=67385 RepID=UPI0034461D6E